MPMGQCYKCCSALGLSANISKTRETGTYDLGFLSAPFHGSLC